MQVPLPPSFQPPTHEADVQSPPLELDLELEIRDLLNEAKTFMAPGHLSPGELVDLIAELVDCASRSKSAGFPFSERKLSATAKALQELMPARLGKTA